MTGFFIAAGLIVAGILGIITLSGIRFISNTRIGIVEKRFSPKGSIKSGFIALNGEAGFQPKVLRGGRRRQGKRRQQYQYHGRLARHAAL